MIVEAEKSHDGPSASWRPRTVSSIIPAYVWKPDTRGACEVNPSPRAGED